MPEPYDRPWILELLFDAVGIAAVGSFGLGTEPRGSSKRRAFATGTIAEYGRSVGPTEGAQRVPAGPRHLGQKIAL